MPTMLDLLAVSSNASVKTLKDLSFTPPESRGVLLYCVNHNIGIFFPGGGRMYNVALFINKPAKVCGLSLRFFLSWTFPTAKTKYNRYLVDSSHEPFRRW